MGNTGFRSKFCGKKYYEEGHNDRMTYGAAYMTGWRTDQQDAHICALDITDHTHMFSVFDGHGGSTVSNFAADSMVETFLKKWKKPHKADTISKAIRQAYMSMDVQMRSKKGKERLIEFYDKLSKWQEEENQSPEAQEGDELYSSDDEEVLDDDEDEDDEEEEEEEKEGGGDEDDGEEGEDIAALDQDELERLMLDAAGEEYDEEDEAEAMEKDKSDTDFVGCTAVTAIIHENTVICANSGDSRCVLSSGGKAIPLSFDHKPTDDDELDRVEKAGGYVSNEGRINDNLNVSRCFGDTEFKKNTKLPPEQQMITANPDIEVHQLDDKAEFIIVACDGIWEVMENEEAVEFVRERIVEGQSLETIAGDLMHACAFHSNPDAYGEKPKAKMWENYFKARDMKEKKKKLTKSEQKFVEEAQSVMGCGRDNMTVVIAAFNNFCRDAANKTTKKATKNAPAKTQSKKRASEEAPSSPTKRVKSQGGKERKKEVSPPHSAKNAKDQGKAKKKKK